LASRLLEGFGYEDGIGARLSTRQRSALRGLITAAGVAVLATVLALSLFARPRDELPLERAQAGECRDADVVPAQLTPDRARAAIVCLLDEERADRDRGELDPSRSLREAAKRHSAYMRRHECFSHRCPGEKNLEGRLRASGYIPCDCRWGIGENLAWGEGASGAPEAIVEEWMNSPPHRENVLDGAFRQVDVGVVRGVPENDEQAASAMTFTANFGYKRG
jgi:hypothetical protein